MSDAETPAADAPQEAPAPMLQIFFHAPDGAAIVTVGCPLAALDANGVHLPALEVLQGLAANYLEWQNAQPKPSGILVPGHGPLNVHLQHDESLRNALQQLHPRPGKQRD